MLRAPSAPVSAAPVPDAGFRPPDDGGVALIDVVHAWRSETPLRLPSLSLPAGAHAVITGPSGCGKTTLLSLLAGLLPLRVGRITVAGQDYTALAAGGQKAVDRFRSQRIGLVPQQPMLFGVLDVLDNLLIAQHFADRPTDRPGALALLEQLGLGGLGHRRPRELSRGQQQRVALARALVNRPALILADEPTANLDDAHAAQALSLLRERSQALGATLLIATHDARVRDRFDIVFAMPPPGGASR
jgi:putative ABC transport system ATP-binding protein